MAKGKPTPDKSKIERTRPLAYSRRQKGSGGLGGPAASGEVDKDKDEDDKDEKGDAAEPAKPETAEATSEPPTEPAATAEADASAGEPPAIEPPPPKGEPWPDATPQPMRPVEPARARSEPVAVPTTTPSSVEDPTFMPAPRDVPAGHPEDPASPPGLVPSGDSRSLRKDNEFALVYRVQTAVISRFGVVGTRGQWRVVDYPTSSSASNAYAKEVSRFVAEGFSDYRD